MHRQGDAGGVGSEGKEKEREKSDPNETS